MGLMKKLVERAAASAPDYGAAITACLGPDERMLAMAHALHLALEGDTNLRRQGLIGAGINAITDKVHQHRYLSGDAGSCALAIPRDGASGRVVMAVTDRRLALFSFGTSMRELPPRELVSFPRSSVRSITAGESSRYGTHTTFRFVDDSFVVFDVYTDPGTDAFRAASAAFGG